MTTPAGPAAGLALYRKYRSATFAELIGQEHVTRPLSTALDHGRINHAYLFSGPRGCGKTSSARILARSLNCVQGPTSTPCGVCDSCVELAPNGPGSIDVIEIDAASHNGVDDARDLRERAWYAPVRDRYKVYIVDEAHMVTTAAFNALLKLVEEPPDFLVFVFATTEPDKVLQTIRSRTHHYPFRLVPPSILRGHLEAICAREGVTVEPTVLPLVTRAGGGSVRDSLSILDQLLAGSGDDGLLYRDAIGLLGVTDSALLDTVVDALAAGDSAGVFGAVDQVVEAGHDPRRFAADLLDRFRDLVILDAVPNAGESGLLDVPADILERMSDQGRRLGRASVTRFAEIVHQALVDMRGTTAPRLVLELVCARMLLPDAASDAAALLQRVEALERRASMSGSAAAAPAAPAAAAPRSAERTAEPAAASSPPRSRERAPEPPAPSPAPRPADRAPEPKPADASPRSRERAPEPGAASTPPRPAERAPEPGAASTPPRSAERAPEAKPASAPPRPAERTPGRTPERTDPPGAAEPVTVTGPSAAADAAPVRQVPAADGLDANRVRELWENSIRDSIPSRRTRALLHDAQVLGVDGSSLTLSMPHAPLAKMLSEESNLGPIRAALQQALGGTWKVEVVVGGAVNSTPVVEPPVGSGSASTWSGGANDRPARKPATPDQVAGEPPADPPPPDPMDSLDPRDNSEPLGDPDPATGRRAHDPEIAAIDLLRNQLGAKPVDPSLGQ
ncbi:DNA polymerase III subunit gamma and tau [Jatrophihabitans sp. YIM 134969]